MPLSGSSPKPERTGGRDNIVERVRFTPEENFMDLPVVNAREARDTFLFGRGAAWFAYGMTIALMVFDYLDRQVIVSMFPFLKAEWNLSDKELGLLVSVISVTVAVFGIPVAWIADRISRVKSIVAMAGRWRRALH